jgi:hypothetical protein
MSNIDYNNIIALNIRVMTVSSEQSLLTTLFKNALKTGVGVSDKWR